MRNEKTQKWGKRCPTNENHGFLLPFYDSTTLDAWICPHGEHARSKPPTKCTFTDEEADGNSPVSETPKDNKPIFAGRKNRTSKRADGAKP